MTLRTLAHALIILAVMLITAALATRGLRTILEQVGFASFIPFALATAAATNNHKPLLISTIAITILLLIPCSISRLAHALVPIGAGILLGVALNKALTQEPTT